MFRQELTRLSRFLLVLGGHEPDGRDLREIIRAYEVARNRLLDAAADYNARDYAEAIAQFHWDSSPSPRSERGPDPGEKHPSPGKLSAGVPLALIGGPLPRSRWHLLDSIEKAGGRIVLNGTEAGERSLWRSIRASIGSEAASLAAEPASTQGGLDVLARDYCAHCTDAFQRPNTRLYDWLGQRVTERKVRGILLWEYVGCDLWRAEAASLREALGLPVLGLDADETGSDFPRTLGRIEAFIESLSTL